MHAALARHRVQFDGLSHALYEDTGLEDRPVRLTTALNLPKGVPINDDGVSTVDIEAVEVPRPVVPGSPEEFKDTFRALHEWADLAGEITTRFERELYIDCDGPRDTWVTELQTILEPRT